MQADVSRVSSLAVPRFLLRNRLLIACIAFQSLTAFAVSVFLGGAGRAMLVFLAVIVIGAVLLAWHYAIDAYLGMALAYLGWKLSVWLVRRDGMA